MSSTFLCVLILRCATPERVASWYRDVLGIPLLEGNHDFSYMSAQVRFAIHGLQEGQAPTTGVEIGFHFPDLDAVVKRLQSKKVKLIDPIRQYPWAKSAQIEDPLGNLIYLMELPKESIREIGKQVVKQFEALSGS